MVEGEGRAVVEATGARTRLASIALLNPGRPPAPQPLARELESSNRGTGRDRRGPGVKAWEQVPDPQIIDGTDVIVRVEATTICGTDLHILKCDVPAVTDGRILGHEAVGTVIAVGESVRRVKLGDRVLVSCITSCGTCEYAGAAMPVKASEVAAGSSATRSTARRPNRCGFPSPTYRRIPSPTASATERC